MRAPVSHAQIPTPIAAGSFGVPLAGRYTEAEIEGEVAHVDYKRSRIKQYHKEGRALRTETVINDSYDFDIGRRLSNFDQLRELVSCLRNPLAVDLSDSRIWSALLVQMNGFGFSLWTLRYSSIARSNSSVLRCVPRRIWRSVIAANHRSTWLIQDALVGVKCRWKRGWPANQSCIIAVL